MKVSLKTVLFGFIMGVLGASHLAAEDANHLAALTVAPFNGNPAQIPGWQPALGQGISEMLSETLENSDNRFQVAEATEAAGSDYTLYGEVAQFSTQTNSSQVGDFVSSSPFGNLGVKVFTAHVVFEWHIVDTETKRVIKRGTIACSAHGSGFNVAGSASAAGKTSTAGSAATDVKNAVGGKSGTKNSESINNIFSGLNKAFGDTPGEGSGSDGAKGKDGTTAQSAKTSSKAGGESGGGNNSETIGYDNPAFMESALGKATAEAITNIVRQLAAVSLPASSRVAKLEAATVALKHNPGKVLAVAGKDTIIVSLGSKEGFREGDKLNLYEPDDVKDDKGNVVFTDEKLVGEITLESVQEERSRASYAGGAVVKQGWTVKAE